MQGVAHVSLRSNPTGFAARRVAGPLVILGTVLCISSALVWLGQVGWPGLHRDAAAYATPIINQNNGRGHTVSVYYLAGGIAPGMKFAIHGQLYQFVFGRVFRCATYPELLRALGWLNAITVAASALCMFVYLRFGLRLSGWLVAAGSCAGSAGAAAVVLALQGRPEQIIPLIGAVAGLLRAAAASPRGRLGVNGVEIALVGLASPAPGVILAGAHTAAVFVSPAVRGPIVAVVWLAAIALAAWLALMQAVFPFAIAEWFSNSTRGVGALGPRGLSMVPAVWIYNYNHPLMILTPAALGLAFLAALGRLRNRPARLTIAGVIVLGQFAVWLMRGGFLYYGINYTLTALFLQFWLLSLWIARELAEDRRDDVPALAAGTPPARLSFGALVALALIVCGAGAALGVARHWVLGQSYVARGVSLAAADELLKPLLPRLRAGERIAIMDSSHPSLVTLADVDPDLLWLQRPDTELAALEEGLHVRIRFLIVPQFFDPAPDRFGPFALVEDHFLRGAETFCGLRIADFPPGYQFAVYERVS